MCIKIVQPWREEPRYLKMPLIFKKKIIKKGALRLGAVTGIPLGSPSSPVCMCVFVDSETHVSIHHPGRATGFTQVEGIIFLSTLWYPAVLSEPSFGTFTSLSVRPWAPLGLHASAVLQDWATMWYFQGYCVYERFLCVTVVKGLLLLAAKTAVRLAVKKVNFFFFFSLMILMNSKDVVIIYFSVELLTLHCRSWAKSYDSREPTGA